MKLKRYWGKVLDISMVLLLLVSVSSIAIGAVNFSLNTDNPLNPQVVIRVGTVAEASGTVDYVCDGTDDNIQFQGALDALPANGGTIEILSGNYDVSATVTRALDNVTITGTGRGTYITFNGVNYIFTAGGNNWKFENLRTDAGSLNMGATTGWAWENVTINADYYAYRTPRASTTGADWEVPTGRGATYVVACSNSSASDKAQADAVLTGTNDHTQISNIFASLPAIVGKVQFLAGTIDINGGITITTYDDLVIEGMGRDTIFEITGSLVTPLLWNDVGGDGIVLKDFRVVDTLINRSAIVAGTTPIYFESSHNITVTGVTIEGTAGGVANDTTQGIIMNNCYDVRITDCRFSNLGSYGINTQGSGATICHHIIIANNYFYNIFYNAIALYQNTHDFTVTGNIIDGAGHGGIAVSSGYNGSITGNCVYNVTTIDEGGIEVENGHVMGAGAPLTYNISVTGNTVTGCYWGIYIRVQNAQPDPYNITITGNTVHGSTNKGIYATSDTDYIIISDNTVKSTVGIGIDVDGNNCTISGNLVTNTTGDGIDLTGGKLSVTGNTIAENTNGIDMTGGGSSVFDGNVAYNNSGTGIKVATNYCLISNNVCNDNDIGIGITGDYCIAQGNICRDTAATGVAQRYGIVLYAGSEYCIIAGNELVTHTVAELLDSSASLTNTFQVNKGYISTGEIRTFSVAITAGGAGTKTAWQNPFAQDCLVQNVTIRLTVGDADAANGDCGVVADAATVGTDIFADLTCEITGVYYSYTAAGGGTQTLPIVLNAAGGANDYITFTLSDNDGTSVVGYIYITIVGI